MLIIAYRRSPHYPKRYYDLSGKKIKFKGKATRVWICAVTGKLCGWVFSMVKSGKPYQVRPSLT